MSKCALFIKNFPGKFKETDFRNNFGRFGEIKNVIVKLEYAIVEYENRADAIEA